MAPVRQLHRVKSRRMPESAVYVLEKMAHGYKRLGREVGAGFYDYGEGEATQLWSGLKTFERGSKPVPPDDVRDRLLFASSIEALRFMTEGLVESAAAEKEDGSLGWGFPAATGGPLEFIRRLGPQRFMQRADELSARYGERFHLGPDLRLRLQSSLGQE